MGQANDICLDIIIFLSCWFCVMRIVYSKCYTHRNVDTQQSYGVLYDAVCYATN